MTTHPANAPLRSHGARQRRAQMLAALGVSVALHVAVLAAGSAPASAIGDRRAGTAWPTTPAAPSPGVVTALATVATVATVANGEKVGAPGPVEAVTQAAPPSGRKPKQEASAGTEPFKPFDRPSERSREVLAQSPPALSKEPAATPPPADGPPSPAVEPPKPLSLQATTPPLATAATAAATSAPAPLTPPSTPAAAMPAAQGEPPPPVYPTRVPAPVRMAFDMKRGAVGGTAELVWQTSNAGYELSLATRVLGAEVLGLSSRGQLDAAGLAPQRFVDRRRGRDRLAANFDAVTRRITYSGNAPAQTLHAGTQDRLSWMLQLPAIVQAEPERWKPGARIEVYVSGARGDADTWTFQVHPRESVTVPAGVTPQALRLTREPRKPYDTQVEVWLDPSRQHLPVRARMTVLPGGETLDLKLTGISAP